MKLLPYQQEGVEGIYGMRGRCLLADEQGLGKTIQSLYWINKIPGHRPVVIVTPASVKYNWQLEAQTHFGMHVEVIEGNRPKRTMTLPGEIVVINYDILKSWLPALLRAAPKCVVLDEVQYIKNPDTQRTKATWQLCENARSVVGCSGTPFENRPIELWPILKAIRPDIYPNFEQFAWRYTKPFKWRGRWHYEGSLNEAELHRILKKNVMIRRLKKDVLPDLLPKVRKMVPFKMKGMAEYNFAEKEFIAWLRKTSIAKANRAKRSAAMSKIGYLLRFVAVQKTEWIKKWIKDFLDSNPGKKLVCFTMHTSVIEALQAHFSAQCVVINGKVTGIKRHEAVRKFQSNKRVRLLFGNWKAAGVGLTLTAADTVAALDLPWTPGLMMQGEDRIHRIGQKFKCVIHYLLAKDTVEERQVAMLLRKSKVLDAILNGTRTTKHLDLFTEVLKEMKAA